MIKKATLLSHLEPSKRKDIRAELTKVKEMRKGQLKAFDELILRTIKDNIRFIDDVLKGHQSIENLQKHNKVLTKRLKYILRK